MPDLSLDLQACYGCKSLKKLQPGLIFVSGLLGWLPDGFVAWVNLDVALWVGRRGRGAGRNELGCSAEWTLGIDP